jgi:23S rRNA (uracil1939-C5)-methyltransferase
VETVVLLSHKKADTYINVNVEFGEGEGKTPVGKIVVKAEDQRPSERVTYKMIQEYIESKYGFKVHSCFLRRCKTKCIGLHMVSRKDLLRSKCR